MRTRSTAESRSAAQRCRTTTHPCRSGRCELAHCCPVFAPLDQKPSVRCRPRIGHCDCARPMTASGAQRTSSIRRWLGDAEVVATIVDCGECRQSGSRRTAASCSVTARPRPTDTARGQAMPSFRRNGETTATGSQLRARSPASVLHMFVSVLVSGASRSLGTPGPA